MPPTVNPYSSRVDVCRLGVLGRLAFFSNQHDFFPAQLPGSEMRRASIHTVFGIVLSLHARWLVIAVDVVITDADNVNLSLQ
jgi:hypothetical protein